MQNLKMSEYYEWRYFENIYLEDSYVLEIKESNEQLSFIMDIVLHENHYLYSKPLQGEQYCYKKGKIVFRRLNSIKWISRNLKPIIDIDGTEDFGNIDCFELSSDGYYIEGEWGEVIVDSAPPVLEWLK